MMYYTLMPCYGSPELVCPNPAHNGVLSLRARYTDAGRWVCSAPFGALVGTDRRCGSELLYSGDKSPRIIIDGAAFVAATTEFHGGEPQWQLLADALGDVVDTTSESMGLPRASDVVENDVTGMVLGDGVIHVAGATVFFAPCGAICAGQFDGWFVRTADGLQEIDYTADFIYALRIDGWTIGAEAQKRLKPFEPLDPIPAYLAGIWE